MFFARWYIDCTERKYRKLVLGASLGAGLALLFAPKKGSELREDLKNRINDLVNRAKEVDVKEVQENLENKIEEIKNEIINKWIKNIILMQPQVK